MILTEVMSDEEYIESYQKFLFQMAEDEEVLQEATIGNEILLEAEEGPIRKLINRIKEIFKKFFRKVGNLSTSNEKWLAKYEDIIMNKPIKEATFKDYYQYDIEQIKNLEIPKLDDNLLTTAAGATNKEEFIQKINGFSKYMRDRNQSFTDNLKNALRGQKHDTYPSQRADIKAMYGYCKGYNSTVKDGIYKSMDAIENSEKNLDRIKVNVGKSASTFSKDKVDTNNANKPADNTEKQNESHIFTFDQTMDYYFNELGISEATIEDKPEEKKPEDNAGGEKKPTGGNTPAQNSTANNANDQQQKQEEKDNAEKEKLIRFYFTVAAEMVGTQLNIANEAYKTFVQILKWHIKHYDPNAQVEGEKVGDEETGQNNAEGNDAAKPAGDNAGGGDNQDNKGEGNNDGGTKSDTATGDANGNADNTKDATDNGKKEEQKEGDNPAPEKKVNGLYAKAKSLFSNKKLDPKEKGKFKEELLNGLESLGGKIRNSKTLKRAMNAAKKINTKKSNKDDIKNVEDTLKDVEEEIKKEAFLDDYGNSFLLEADMGLEFLDAHYTEGTKTYYRDMSDMFLSPVYTEEQEEALVESADRILEAFCDAYIEENESTIAELLDGIFNEHDIMDMMMEDVSRILALDEAEESLDEGMIFSGRDAKYNWNAWEKGEVNLLLSMGRGKTQVKKGVHCIDFEKDIALNFDYDDEELFSKDPMIKAWFTGPGEKFRWHIMAHAQTTQVQMERIIEKFITFARSYCKSHKNLKYEIDFGAYSVYMAALKLDYKDVAVLARDRNEILGYAKQINSYLTNKKRNIALRVGGAAASAIVAPLAIGTYAGTNAGMRFNVRGMEKRRKKAEMKTRKEDKKEEMNARKEEKKAEKKESVKEDYMEEGVFVNLPDSKYNWDAWKNGKVNLYLL